MPSFFKKVKIIRDKERQGNCHRPEETKGTQSNQTQCGLNLDTEKGWNPHKVHGFVYSIVPMLISYIWWLYNSLHKMSKLGQAGWTFYTIFATSVSLKWSQNKIKICFQLITPEKKLFF